MRQTSHIHVVTKRLSLGPRDWGSAMQLYPRVGSFVPLTACRLTRSCFAVSANLRLPSSSSSWTVESCMPHQEYLTKPEEISKRLERHMRTLRWPCAACFAVKGDTYALPFRWHVEPSAAEWKANAEYLAGFFDGDGCVSCLTNLCGVRLSVGRRASAADVLLLYLRCFGGTVSLRSPGQGMTQPMLQWQVSGAKARSAASSLASVSLTKSEQLKIAATWPRCPNERLSSSERLKFLKRKTERSDLRVGPPCMSWSYVAGFFDAEGCIQVRSSASGVQLQFSQRDRPVLEAICVFLQTEVLECNHLHVRRTCNSEHRLVIGSNKASLLVLHRLLSCGLLVKREAAEFVCVTPEQSFGHESMRLGSSINKGNQSRYRKLDAEGCQRALQIKRLQDRLLYARTVKLTDATQSLQAQLDDAKLEHAVRSVQSRIRKLRRDIAWIGKLSTS